MKNAILRMIRRIVGDDSIECNEELIESELLDSIGMAILIANLEEEFCITIDIEDVIPDNFSSVDDIEAMIIKYKED